jgi:hypothetical protein
MIRTQRFTPDTCANPAAGDACQLIEQWDDAVDQVARIHTMVTVEKQCSRHAGLENAACYARNYEENRRKNTALAAAQAIKSGIDHQAFSWSYDSTGLLTVSFGAELTAPQKAQLQNILNIQFGPNKASVA